MYGQPAGRHRQLRIPSAGCATVRDECTTMRASITASEPLPLAVPLYECSVFPVPVIDPGTYVIDCPAATATDADGAPLPIACQSALVRILPYELPPTATPTPTGAVPPGSPPAAQVTPTFTAALRGTATATAAPFVASNEDDGCQVGAPTGAGAFVALLGPALLLAWRTRRAVTPHRAGAAGEPPALPASGAVAGARGQSSGGGLKPAATPAALATTLHAPPGGRSARRRTLPLRVRGRSSTRYTTRGALYEARCWRA